MKNYWLSTIVGMAIFTLALPVHAASTYTTKASGAEYVSVEYPDGRATDASCRVTLQTNEDESKLKYRMECYNAVGITEAYLHVGPEGTIGPAVAQLFGVPSHRPYFDPQIPTGPVSGLLTEGTLRDGGDTLTMPIEDLLWDMHNGDIYVNIATERNIRGEVRGQIGAF